MAEATPSPTPAPAPSSAPAPAPNGTAGAPWFGDLSSNPELKTWVDGKKFDSPAVALEAHRNTERMVGVPADRLIRKPKDANDAEGIKAYRTALGVPDDPKAYDLPVPQGQPATLVDWAKPVFHKHGLTPDQAKGVTADWNAYVESEVKAAETRDKEALAAAETGLRSEWGGQYETNRELARRAFTTFVEKAGMGDAASKVDEVMGVPGAMKLWNAIGKAMGESTFKTGEPPPATVTPADAKTKIAALRADPEWMKAYTAGDLNKQLEFQTLMAIQTGDDSGLKVVQKKMAANR